MKPLYLPKRVRQVGLFIFISMSSVYGQAQKHIVPQKFEHYADVIDARFDLEDKLIITTSSNRQVKLWEAGTGTFIRAFSYAGPRSHWFAAEFSSDGKSVAIINGRGGKMWNTKFGDVVGPIFGFSDDIRTVRFSQNGRWVVAASEDGTAIIYSADNGVLQHTLNHEKETFGKSDHRHGITDAQFCDGDRIVITGSGEPLNTKTTAYDSLNIQKYDSVLLRWDVKTGKVVGRMTGYPFTVSRDGARVATGSMNTVQNVARIWDAATGKLLLTLKGHQGKINHCEFSADGQSILTHSEDGEVRMWDNSGKLKHTSNVSTEAIVRLNPNGKQWIVTSSDTTKLMDPMSGKTLLAVHSHLPGVFSHNGSRLILFEGHHASCYDTATGLPMMIIPDENHKGIKVIR